MNSVPSQQDKGSVELVVLGLLAALIIVLALPLISGIDSDASQKSRHVQVNPIK